MLDKKDIEEVNREARAKDESHLWPIKGRFNVTERAIRRVRKYVREGLEIDEKYSYTAILEAEMSEIVNNERNW